ncbi:hypothetical protein NE237_032109 [Protea cynaroides]|uniref:Uncharacterized protein n=1 Tax=Protea cynaroides TaxID=273540 RepID=A0A9Q0L2N7_9MAGN|nr:hypothetical protein NE237_032109 [Protea cynaroides]
MPRDAARSSLLRHAEVPRSSPRLCLLGHAEVRGSAMWSGLLGHAEVPKSARRLGLFGHADVPWVLYGPVYPVILRCRVPRFQTYSVMPRCPMGIYGPRTMYVLALEGYPDTHELLLLDEADQLLYKREVPIVVHRKNGAGVNQIIVKEKVCAGQVVEPLRAMVMGAPLEDARRLAQRYDRMQLEAWKLSLFNFYSKSILIIEVTRRQVKVKESVGGIDNVTKLEAAEGKLHELKSNVATLGKEAVAARAVVEPRKTVASSLMSSVTDSLN